MKMPSSMVIAVAAAFVVIAALLVVPARTFAHCDTLDGPVVMDARTALDNGDVTPVLKWVSKNDEAEIREAFQKTLAVRSRGPEAKELADMYFFETLVRIHRAGEDAPYTGLKPAGTELDPAVVAADKALQSGSVDELVRMVNDAVAAGIGARFAHAREMKEHVNESVEAGREYIEAYVTFVHYVEKLHLDAAGTAAHHAEAEPGEESHKKEH